MRGLVFSLILSSLILGGCAKKSRTPGPPAQQPGAGPEETGEYLPQRVSQVNKNVPPPKPEPAEAVAGSEWSPAEVTVTCVEKACPIQVGVLIFASPPTNGFFLLNTCTAFLIEKNTIATNGHCDSLGARKGYFISQPVNGKPITRAITGRVYKNFALPRDPEHIKNGLSSGRPDVLFLSLDKPIEEMPPLKLASGKPVPMKKLETFSIHSTSTKTYMVIRHECEVRRNELRFPFEIEEAPDVIQAYGCEGIPGNSGSPMFMPGSEEVQFIVMTGDSPKRIAERKKISESQVPIQDQHLVAGATNVRCLAYPGAKPIRCVQNDEEERQRRWRSYQIGRMEEDRVRPFAKADEYPFRFRTHSFQLAQDRYDFEVIHVPWCRLRRESFSTLTVPVEALRFESDKWGTLTSRVVGTQLVQAKVLQEFEDESVQLQIVWPKAKGPYLHPEKDLRRRWGDTFTIDLPQCAR